MAHFNLASPRVVSASFLAMCATVGMPSPALPTTPTMCPMSAPAEWTSLMSSPAFLTDITLSGPQSSLLARRRYAHQSKPQGLGLGLEPTSAKEAPKEDVLKLDFEGLELSPTLAFADKTPSTPAFEFFGESKDGAVTPMFESINPTHIGEKNVGLGICLPESLVEGQSTVLKPCLKSDNDKFNTYRANTSKRRVEFSEDVRVHHPLAYPIELEDEDDIPVEVQDKLTPMVDPRRPSSSKKSFGQLGRGHPSSAIPDRVRFSPEVNIARYSHTSMHIKPLTQLRTVSFTREQTVYRYPARRPATTIPHQVFAARIRRASQDLTSIPEERIAPSGLSPRLPTKPTLGPVHMDDVVVSPIQPLPSPQVAFTVEEARRSHHQMLNLDSFSKTLF